jgi:hypothetical protein
VEAADEVGPAGEGYCGGGGVLHLGVGEELEELFEGGEFGGFAAVEQGE